MYYQGEDAVASDQVFMTHELASDTDILPWHFDRQESLKFYVNLLPVTLDNGAFQYDVGSHREGHLIANNFILQGVPVGQIPNDIPEEFLRNPVVIEVDAGDLVVFDAAGYHKAGSVSLGNERMVIRGHSHPLPVVTYKAKLFSSNWFSERFFNIQKYLGPKVCRRWSARLYNKLVLTRN